MFYDLWKLAAAFACAVIAAFVLYRDPASKTFAIFLFSLVGVTVCFITAAWFHQSRQIDEWARRQGDTPVHYSLTEDAVESRSQLGATKLNWDAFSKMRISEDDTLLFYSKVAALTLPTKQVPEEALAYLASRFSHYTKPIEDRRKRG